jgi:hypothetical protein
MNQGLPPGSDKNEIYTFTITTVTILMIGRNMTARNN